MINTNINLAYALCCDKDRIIPDLVDINRSNDILNTNRLNYNVILPDNIDIFKSYDINVNEVIISKIFNEYLKALHKKIFNEIENHSIHINKFPLYDKIISFIYKLFNKKYIRYIKKDKLKNEIIKQYYKLKSDICLVIHPSILYKYNEIFTTNHINSTYKFINHSVYVNEYIPENSLYLIKYKNGNRNNMNLYLSDINVDTQENIIESYVNYRLDVMDDKFGVKINTAIC